MEAFNSRISSTHSYKQVALNGMHKQGPRELTRLGLYLKRKEINVCSTDALKTGLDCSTPNFPLQAATFKCDLVSSYFCPLAAVLLY